MKGYIIGAGLAGFIIGNAVIVGHPIADRYHATRVIDGDTVARGKVHYRLIGFDAPEQRHPRCEQEALLANRATDRMRELFRLGATLEELPGNCAWGRRCAVAHYGGRDVASIMIEEGLAHKLICPGGRCPPREGWCQL